MRQRPFATSKVAVSSTELIRVSGSDLWEWRRNARAAASGVEIDPLEVDWLLRALSPELDRLALGLEALRECPTVEIAASLADLERLWARRLRDRVPVQYLAGETPWRDLLLRVSPAVLVPRPETELLVDLALQAADERRPLAAGTWIDLGTGSGAIAIALARALPEARVYGVDVSTAALEIARANGRRYALENRLSWLQGSWFAPIATLSPPLQLLQGMIANPPYIPSTELQELQPEVREHEPHLALDGGADGLDCVRELVAMAPAYLEPGGFWGVELAIEQAPRVAALLEENGAYCNLRIVPDLAGIDRFVIAHRR